MKKITYILLGLSLAFVQCKNRKPADEVATLLFTISEQYCGGAAPEPALVDELAKPKPLVSDTIYILLQGQELSEAKAYVTSKKGIITAALPNGDHSAFLYNPVIPEDQSALTEKERCELGWKTMFMQPFTLDPTTRSMEINFFLNCNPCEEPRP